MHQSGAPSSGVTVSVLRRQQSPPRWTGRQSVVVAKLSAFSSDLCLLLCLPVVPSVVDVSHLSVHHCYVGWLSHHLRSLPESSCSASHAFEIEPTPQEKNDLHSRFFLLLFWGGFSLTRCETQYQEFPFSLENILYVISFLCVEMNFTACFAKPTPAGSCVLWCDATPIGLR